MEDELLKVPDSAIIKDLIKVLKSKNIEIGQFKSYIQEKNYAIKQKNIEITRLKKQLKNYM